MDRIAFRDRIYKGLERYSTAVARMPMVFRVGAGYGSAARAIRAAERHDDRTAEALLLQRLQELLAHANTHVPFYREFYQARGYSPKTLRTLGDWEQVPVVTKQDLQSHPLAGRCCPGRPGVLSNTGGTSGAPLAFMIERHSAPTEWAHMHRVWSAHGYRISQLKLRIGGAYLQHAAPISYHPRHNEYIVNANSPMSEVVKAVLALPSDKRFRWVHGYPSLVAEFAQALAASKDAAAGRFVANLFGVLLGSEFAAPVYRVPIATLLSSNIVSWYGHSEMALLARETAEGLFQSLPTYGYAEAVSSIDGQSQRLVCTSLHNRVHPFIRYDTGDLISGVASGGGSLAFRIQEGRIGDFVVDRNGRRLSLTSIIFGRHHAAFDHALHLQVRQARPGHITLLVVPQTLPGDPAQLSAGFDFTGLDLGFDVQILDKPLRTVAGKLKLKVDA
jgi:phenylacetate-CoA ligase